MGEIRSILFVCTGNSCRSVMAEALMRRKLHDLGRDIEVSSAGVLALHGLPPTEEAIAIMNEADLDVAGFRTKPLNFEMIRKADLILTMEPAHKEHVVSMMPAAASKTFMLKEYRNPSKILPKGFSVQDPIGRPAADYRACRNEISAEIDRIAKLI